MVHVYNNGHYQYSLGMYAEGLYAYDWVLGMSTRATPSWPKADSIATLVLALRHREKTVLARACRQHFMSRT